VSEQAGRYQRSTQGLVGALIVTLVVIAAFVAFRALNRDDLEIKPEPVDYLGSVKYIEQSGDSVVYPPALPKGWICTTAHYAPGRHPEWDLGVLTDAGTFVGLREEDAPVDELVRDYVDKNAAEGPPVHLDSPLGRQWRTFTDSGGDYALVVERDDETLIVYGSADDQEIRDFAASLVAGSVSPGTRGN
jgi:hypothetical protein